MKVKKLEWQNVNFGYMYISTAKMYTILNVSYRDKPQITRECKFASEVFYVAKTLKEAKEACQSHFEKFLFSQIIPENLDEKRILAKSIDLRDNHVMNDLGNGYSQILPIDPNKRFGDSEPVKAFDPTLLGFKYYESENIYSTKIDEYHFLGDPDICLVFDGGHSQSWALFNREGEVIFDGIKIPDHDFGVKLLSQFLEVE